MSPLSLGTLIGAFVVTLGTVVTLADGPLLPDSVNAPTILAMMLAWLAYLIAAARDRVIDAVIDQSKRVERVLCARMDIHEANLLSHAMGVRGEVRHLKSVE